MRDAIHQYLSGRPSGATAEELIGLIFTRPGSDTSLGPRFLQTMLGGDSRFAFDEQRLRWRAAIHQHLVLPLEDATFVVVDLETTGGAPSQGESIIEIGAVKISGGTVVDTFQTLVDPGRPLPRFITRLTGISDEMLAGQPRIRQALPDFARFAGEHVMVAHNARFDRGFLDAASRAVLDRPVTSNFLCTLRLARRLLPTLRRRGLDALAGHFGIPCVDRHRALGDARMTAEVLFHFLDALPKRGVLTVAEALDYQGLASDGRRFFCMLPRSAVASLPRGPGIYRFTDQDGELLYIGKAGNLHQRVSSYLSNSKGHSRKTLDLIRNIRSVDVEETGSELEASLLEAELIRARQPPYNVLRKHLPRIAYLKLTVANNFPRFSIATRPSGRSARYFGPFRSRSHAERAIDTLTRAFRLRTCTGTLRPAPDVPVCFQGQIGNCTRPCNLGTDAEGYRSQVAAFLNFFDDGETSVFEALEERREAASQQLRFESAARVQRDIDLLHHLRKRHRQMGWVVEQHHFAVVQPTADGASHLLYLVVHGRLLARTQLDETTDLPALIHLVSEQLNQAKPRGIKAEEVDGTTILAAWLRDRGDDDGYVIPISRDEKCFDASRSEAPDWALQVRALAGSPRIQRLAE